jgi:hypothetical protein
LHASNAAENVQQCVRGGGRLNVIASIEEPKLMDRMLPDKR